MYTATYRLVHRNVGENNTRVKNPEAIPETEECGQIEQDMLSFVCSSLS